jgi:ADP-dependent NAD(P)H-hydrate dehydratase / NAD(P)H-hydrate epimerase
MLGISTRGIAIRTVEQSHEPTRNAVMPGVSTPGTDGLMSSLEDCLKLVSASQMRAIEEEAFSAGATQAGLMETAGRGVAYAVRDRLGDARARRVTVLVGPGNNGGDGLVAARYLYELGAEVSVFLLATRGPDDLNLRSLRELDLDLTILTDEQPLSELESAISRADAVIDAILGIGSRRALDGVIAAALETLKMRRGTLFAVDIPTGLDPDTGDIDSSAVPADVTLTFGFSKLGLHLLPGAAYAGQVRVLDIGVSEPAEGLETEVMTSDWARSLLPNRPLVSNKGSFGRVMVVAGSQSYSGAATLSCLGALRGGAGLVTLAGLPPVRNAVAAQVPETTHLALPEYEEDFAASAGDVIARALATYDVLLIGPGLGQSPGAQALVRGLLASDAAAAVSAVIDADALNALARWPGWHEQIKPRSVLTPHPGELARLARTSVAEVQSRRIGSAIECASSWRQTLVLKGASTVVARPEGSVLLSPFANPALATAGTGDVLAGAIAGLLAQGLEPFAAAGLGVWLHAAGAETFSEEYGSSGLLAGEVAAGVARAAARLRRPQ